ncbi:hypothetical protein [uncultured Aquimarina sp.]|uniref:hypothetical protein n=1 Tax=uncultured Aquimarina sp. TaxID=575652 RepID=UPI0026248EE5|nr:hypothetical protein [uncultured Aquimarina sp.]
MKQNPFSLYDFLGYLIPGSTLIYLFLILENWTDDKSAKNIESIFSSVSKYNFQEIFFFIIASYALGHLISFISSISIEKYGNWKYGYPSKTVIGYKKRSYLIKKEKPLNWEQDLFLYETDSKRCSRYLRNIGRIFLIVILLPLTIVELLFGTLLNFKNFYSKGLDDYLMNTIKRNTLLLLNSEGLSNTTIMTDKDLREIDFNRVVHHYAFENSKQHQFRMVNYVALYGFLRNLVLTFVISFWYYFTVSLKTINGDLSVNWNMVWINLLLMSLSFVAFMAYMKFYRRYTLEGLMLIVVDKNIKTNN